MFLKSVCFVRCFFTYVVYRSFCWRAPKSSSTFLTATVTFPRHRATNAVTSFTKVSVCCICRGLGSAGMASSYSNNWKGSKIFPNARFPTRRPHDTELATSTSVSKSAMRVWHSIIVLAMSCVKSSYAASTLTTAISY